ncbi:MAG: TonB-dependent receptor plug domain-containing protein, partial [Bradyrhizobium sp.]|nr:TonB-dependent receptor plug domain-containing protein [Bradyrhizobium sp.]
MFSFLSVARRHRAGLSSSTVLVSIATFGAAPATAQQSASPDLLPPVEVDPPRKPAAPKPALPRGAQTPRARASQPAATQSAAAQANAQLVVSPTGIATPAAHVANAITVVTAKDIATQQFRSVPDILAAIPGLNVVQTGGAGGQSSVFTRGTNANHTKILIDGIDVGDVTNANGAFDFAHLLTSDIQQFEVLRGPQSGLYGSDAIGGVISVITRKGDGPARATASIETGTYQTFNQSAGVSGSQDNVNYAMNVAHLHA